MSLIETITNAIREAIPDAESEVQGGGGHFTVKVTSGVFANLPTLQAHRLVYTALAPLMKGDDAPVHAIDKLSTQTKG